MPIENYGVFKGNVKNWDEERDNDTPHFQIHMIGEFNRNYRIAVNVMSSDDESVLLYKVDEQYDASAITQLHKMEKGFTPIIYCNRQEIALDYIRGNLFDPRTMKPLPHNVSGPDNDLNELLIKYIEKAKEENAIVYVYGSKWGPEKGQDDKFRFSPKRGIHNVHMNQGNDENGRFGDDNGIWHDGGILIQFTNNWVAIFLAFQSQSWCTNDLGHPIRDCTHED
ncbi:YukJ family protein [Bacillus sp. XF8]|uniref:YukJ family protein n=1 Tax=Bacillus sp. XF8 TaxID=2819289 RepID=UPI001AA04DB1|nr:YukJ family protein [Bacillus sp. XF8]MBO1580709.1 YukJ family protein [Bacillus sp. XF8]